MHASNLKRSEYDGCVYRYASYMTMPNDKATFHADIPMSEETLRALIDIQRARGLPNLEKTIAMVLANALGESKGPLWTPAEIAALSEGMRAILRALAQAPGGLDPSEVSSQSGQGESTKAYLAHLTIRYKHGKDQLHQWDEAAQRYFINPKYRDTVLAALAQ